MNTHTHTSHQSTIQLRQKLLIYLCRMKLYNLCEGHKYQMLNWKIFAKTAPFPALHPSQWHPISTWLGLQICSTSLGICTWSCLTEAEISRNLSKHHAFLGVSSKALRIWPWPESWSSRCLAPEQPPWWPGSPTNDIKTNWWFTRI